MEEPASSHYEAPVTSDASVGDEAFLKWMIVDNAVVFDRENNLDFSERGSYFLIGPNYSGKSSVFELIRRCLSSSKNHSLSSMFHISEPSIALCVYKLNNGQHILTAMVGVPRTDKQQKQMYVKIACKIVKRSNIEKCGVEIVFEDKEELCIKELSESEYGAKLRDKIASLAAGNEKAQEITKRLATIRKENDKIKKELEGNKEANYEKENKVASNEERKNKLEQELTQIRNQALKDIAKELKTHFAGMKGKLETLGKSTETSVCEEILATLDKRVVHIFSSRGIGTVQWTESERLSAKFKDDNYRAASKTAEIITWYERNKNSLTKDENKRVEDYFRIITDGSKVTFNLDNTDEGIPTLYVTNEGDRYPLLKLSEGILEAKTCAIVLAVDQFTTILYEDPEKGMHPQMIQRLRDRILRIIENKTILITTHHPAFTSFWNIDRVFLFRPSKDLIPNTSRKSACIIRVPETIRGDGNASLFLSSWEYSALFFAGSVFFVEGASDNLVITELVDELVQGRWLIEELINDNEKFLNFLESIQVIAVQGKTNFPTVRKICDNLVIDCFTLEDNDEIRDGIYKKPDDETAFKWKNGDIEDVFIKFVNFCGNWSVNNVTEKHKTATMKKKLKKIIKCKYVDDKLIKDGKLKPTADRNYVREFVKYALQMSAEHTHAFEKDTDGGEFIRFVEFLYKMFTFPKSK